MDAVGIIIRSQGYTGLTITNIAKVAGVSRRLINKYYESVDQLVEIYVRGKDYWVAPAGNTGTVMENSGSLDTRSILETLLVNQLEYFSKEEEMQNYLKFVKLYADGRFNLPKIAKTWEHVISDLINKYQTVESRKIPSAVFSYRT